jgi:hypothetical protein
VPSLHFAVGAPDLAPAVAAPAVGAAFAAVAGLEVLSAGAELVDVIALLLAGAVRDEVGPAAVEAAFPAVSGLDVLVAVSPLVVAPLLTPPWWLHAPRPALDEEPSVQVTVAVAVSCA